EVHIAHFQSPVLRKQTPPGGLDAHPADRESLRRHNPIGVPVPSRRSASAHPSQAEPAPSIRCSRPARFRVVVFEREFPMSQPVSLDSAISHPAGLPVVSEDLAALESIRQRVLWLSTSMIH